MRDVVTFDDGSDRRYRWCLCTGCGCMGLELTGEDFGALEDDASGALLCGECLHDALWERATDEAYCEYLHAELEAARTEAQQHGAERRARERVQREASS